MREPSSLPITIAAWRASSASCASRAWTPIAPRSRRRSPTRPNEASSRPKCRSISATGSGSPDEKGGGRARPAVRHARSEACPGTGRRPGRPVDHARPGLCRHALQSVGADQRGQRGPAAARVDVLDGRVGRPRGPAAGRGPHAVRGDPVPERAVRVRPHQARLSAQMEVQPRRGSQRRGDRLLRCEQPRRVLRRGEDRLQRARRSDRRDRLRHREGIVADGDRRSVPGRDPTGLPVHRQASRARRPDDGALVWAYQFTPHDSWDYDATAEMILADLVLGGEERNVLVHFDKNGFAYTLDRATGEVLVAEAFVPVSWATRVDRASGRPVIDSTKLTGASRGNVKALCPSLDGGKTPAAPAAYSARTKLFYVPTNNLCMDYEAVSVTRIAGTPFIGANTPYHAGPGGHLGAFIAWDAARGRTVWAIEEPYPVWSGVLATAGNVVFYGTLDGWFKAVDATTGRPLWKFKVGSGVVGNPIAYTGPDGKQYVAVYAGIGGDWFLLAGDVRSDDPADVRPPADFMRDIARHTSQGGMVWLFGLSP